MFSANNKLVTIPWMLVVVHKACDKYSQIVLSLQELLHVSNLKHVVKSLQAIQNVHNVVIWVLFEVPKSHFSCEVN